MKYIQKGLIYSMKFSLKPYSLFHVIMFIGFVPFSSKLQKFGINYVFILHNIIFYLFGFYLFIMLLQEFFKKKINMFSCLLLLFFLYILVHSFIFSNAKIASLFKAMTLFMTYLYGRYLLKKYNVIKIIKIALYSNLVIVIITLIWIIFNPESAFEGYGLNKVLCGTFPNKNNFATFMVYSTIISLTFNKYNLKNAKDKLIIKFVLISSVIFTILSGSITSIFTLVFAILFTKFNSICNYSINPINISLILNGLVIFMTTLQSKFEVIFKNIFQRDFTLTGRTYIWESILINVKENILWGYGYGTFWDNNPEIVNAIISDYSNKIGGVVVSGSHNGFLELSLQIGLIGTLFFITILIISGRRIAYSNNLVKYFSSLYYFYILLYFITERSLWPLNYQTITLFIIIELSFQRRGITHENLL